MIEYTWLDDYAAKKPGVECAWQPEWEATKYLIAGKMFAMRGGYKDGRPLLTLKLPPDRGDFLRQQYESVIPGYYMNKQHWNSIFLDTGEVAKAELCALLDEAWATMLAALPAKTRKALSNQ